jgi:heptosyltransferase-2
MNTESKSSSEIAQTGPILVVPYQWIGDFVRCHSVVGLLQARFPGRPIDFLTTTNNAPLLRFMPGIRQGIVWDLPRRRLALAEHRALARRLAAENYHQALVMPRTWKSALAPYLAGIPVRTGFAGEIRFGLLNDIRYGERKLPRMVDRCAALALPKDAPPPALPLPELVASAEQRTAWRSSIGLVDRARRVVAFAPGAVGPSKRWPMDYYAGLATALVAAGTTVWVVGGPAERDAAQAIARGNTFIRDLTGPDLGNAVLALAEADVAVSNDSGLLHVAAALGTPTLGIFGPTSPWHWAPLNPLADVLQAKIDLPCRPCHKPVCELGHHRCMRDLGIAEVLAATRAVLAQTQSPAAASTRS